MIKIKSVSILRDLQNMTGHSPEQSHLALALSLLWAGQTREVPSNLIFIFIFMMLYVTAFIPQNIANSREQWAVWIVTALPSQSYSAAISSPGNSLIVNSIFRSVSHFKIWTTDSTQVGEVTLMLNCERRKENQPCRSNWCCSQPAVLGAQWGSPHHKGMLFEPPIQNFFILGRHCFLKAYFYLWHPLRWAVFPFLACLGAEVGRTINDRDKGRSTACSTCPGW